MESKIIELSKYGINLDRLRFYIQNHFHMVMVTMIGSDFVPTLPEKPCMSEFFMLRDVNFKRFGQTIILYLFYLEGYIHHFSSEEQVFGITQDWLDGRITRKDLHLLNKLLLQVDVAYDADEFCSRFGCDADILIGHNHILIERK